MATVEIKGGKQLDAMLKYLSKKAEFNDVVRVGFLENSTCGYDNNASAPMVAAIQNYGAPAASIPRRPFFTIMVKRDSMYWGAWMEKALVKTNYDFPKVLALMGQKIGDNLQQSMVDTDSPPLSEITRMLRMMRKKGGPNFKVTGKIVGEAAARVAAGERASGINEAILLDSKNLLRAVGYEVNSQGEVKANESA